MLEGIKKVDGMKEKKIPSFNTPQVVKFDIVLEHEVEAVEAMPAIPASKTMGGMSVIAAQPAIAAAPAVPAVTLPVTIRRANGRTGITMLALFGKLLGETLGHIVAYDDDNNPEGSKLSQLLESDLTLAGLKTYLVTHALPEVFKSVADVGGDFYTLYEKLLPGHLTLAGVSIDTIQELEEAGPSGAHMIELLWKACEVNFFPTSGAPIMLAGGGRPDESPPEPKVKPQSGTKKAKKGPGGTAKGGQSARMSKRRG